MAKRKKNISNQKIKLPANEINPKSLNVNGFTKKFKWTSFKDWKGFYYKKFKASSILYCNFELMNGHHTTCILPIVEGKVVFNGGNYVIDDSLKYYHLGFQEWMLDFHEGFALPIKRKFPINDINLAIQASNMNNVAYATNPNTLRTFQVNDVIRSTIQAAGITDFFKQVRLLVIIAAIASVLMLLLYANNQGYFSGITG